MTQIQTDDAAIHSANPTALAPRRQKKARATVDANIIELTPSPAHSLTCDDSHSGYDIHPQSAVLQGGGAVRALYGTQTKYDSAPNLSDGHISSKTHDTPTPETGVGGHPIGETQAPLAASPYPIIKALWRQRYAWVKSRTALTLSAQSRCRAFANGDKTEASKLWKAYLKGEPGDAHLYLTLAPYRPAIEMFDSFIGPVEKQLTKLVKALPTYDWLIAHKGIGAIYIAGLHGEAGDISEWRTVSGLWKFFGLAVFDGERQKFHTDLAKNKAQNYNARRRSLISQIETGFIMAGNAEYRAIYDARKAYELERGLPKGHASNRAKRVMGKRFLRELWKQAHQRGANQATEPKDQSPLAEFLEAAE